MKRPSTSSKRRPESGVIRNEAYVRREQASEARAADEASDIIGEAIAHVRRKAKCRRSRLYLIDTYSGGWYIKAPDIATARRKTARAHLKGHFSGGYIVRYLPVTGAFVGGSYPMLKS